MKNILLISHGEMALGTKKAVEMIVGDVSNLHALCLSENIDIQTFRKAFYEEIQKFDFRDQLIIVADLASGSPYISAIEILDENKLLTNSFLISGFNLYLIIGMVMHDGDFEKNDLIDLISKSRNLITLFDEELVIDEDL